MAELALAQSDVLANQATAGPRGVPLSPWAGLGVPAGWSAAALRTGSLLRDA